MEEGRGEVERELILGTVTRGLAGCTLSPIDVAWVVWIMTVGEGDLNEEGLGHTMIIALLKT